MAIPDTGTDSDSDTDPDDLRGEFLGKPDGALRLAAGAEIPCPSTGRQKMLLAALVTANSGETSLKPAARKKLLDRTGHNRTHRPRSRIEALFVSPDVTVKVSFKQPVERGTFGMPRTVLRREFRYTAAVLFIRAMIGLRCERAKDDWLRPEEQVRQQISCDLWTATDQIAGATFELKALMGGNGRTGVDAPR
jgi:hypothetical protein